MTLMEEQIFRETGIQNQAEMKRKLRTLAEGDKDSKINGVSWEISVPQLSDVAGSSAA
jgi:hypothetical protein